MKNPPGFLICVNSQMDSLFVLETRLARGYHTPEYTRTPLSRIAVNRKPR